MGGAPFLCAMVAWRSYQAQLRGYLMRRVSEPALADDLLQDVFLKALQHGPGFCRIDNPRAWLFQVARNALVDHHRLAKPTLPLPDDIAAEPPERDCAQLFEGCVDRVLTRLSADDADIIRDCDLGGMTLAQYAQSRRLSLSAAKSRVQRARRRMRTVMLSLCRTQIDEAGWAPRGPGGAPVA